MSQRTPARTKATSAKTGSTKTSSTKSGGTKTAGTKTGSATTGSTKTGAKAASAKTVGTKSISSKNAASRASAAPTPPAAMLNAVKLMYAGAVLNAIYLIVNLTGISSLKTALREANPKWTSAHVSQAATSDTVYSIVITLVGIGLWLLMAWANKQGRVWARMVSTVLCALNVLNVIPLIAVRSLDLQLALVLIALALSLVAGVVATVLIWRRESTDFYKAASA